MVQPLPIGFSVYLPKGLISHCGLNLQSFLANDFEQHFMCLYAICISSSVIGLFKFLVHFLIEFTGFRAVNKNGKKHSLRELTFYYEKKKRKTNK